MQTKIVLPLVAVGLLAAGGAAAYAAKGGVEEDALNIAQAKFSLVQAVTLAEKQVGGKATRAEFEQGKQGWVYEVEVVAGAKVLDVRVDAQQGTVLSSREDEQDDDHGHEHDGHHDKRD